MESRKSNLQISVIFLVGREINFPECLCGSTVLGEIVMWGVCLWSSFSFAFCFNIETTDFNEKN